MKNTLIVHEMDVHLISTIYRLARICCFVNAHPTDTTLTIGSEAPKEGKQPQIAVRMQAGSLEWRASGATFPLAIRKLHDKVLKDVTLLFPKLREKYNNLQKDFQTADCDLDFLKSYTGRTD